MGEAKRRRAAASEQGEEVLSIGDRGLVISCPMVIDGRALSIRTTALDPQELRVSLLFWDRLAWPQSNVMSISGDGNAKFLESANVLIRPKVHIRFEGDLAEAVGQAHIQAYSNLEKATPGGWALAQGVNSILQSSLNFQEGRGMLVELLRAIPVPDKDVPLEEILEFKRNRRSELLALRDTIDGFYSRIVSSEDKDFELQRTIGKIDAACADLLKVAKESRLSFRLSSLNASFETTLFGPIGAAISGAAVGEWMKGSALEQAISGSIVAQVPLPISLAVLGVATSSIKISRDIGQGRKHIKNNPYRYVYSFHKEVF
ncbi:DUF6236 family protein [Azospirillum sp. ST 5-10]|uniref:DUF6236 family protein n=1 Tax=unclassified Azospirillum TaxID=2630922 RepID=UPI003F49ED6B